MEELLPWLFARKTGGMRWGLERTQALLAGVDHPHRRFCSIHVGGTNGKGSVAALCDAALRSAETGTVGLYTSPHLVDFRERVRVDGAPVEPEVLLAAADRLRPSIEETNASFFEATTAIAFSCFAELNVTLAVVEVGLGGRLDATNVLVPEVAVVTNVAWDHSDILGNSLVEIAREKAGIIKAGVPCVIGATEPEVAAVFRRQAATTGATLIELDRVAQIADVRTGPRGTKFCMTFGAGGEREWFVPLPGEHQAHNAALAAVALAALPAHLRPAADAVDRGWSEMRWPGRLQVEQRSGTTWVFDVAHNAAGVRALARSLPLLNLPQPVVLLVGILADKDWATMLPPLLHSTAAAILTVPPSAPADRCWQPDRALAAIGGGAGKPVRVIPDFGAALRRAVTLAPHGTVLVTGSIHTVGDAMVELGISLGSRKPDSSR